MALLEDHQADCYRPSQAANEPALYLLGPPRLERGLLPIRLDRRKAMALLAYLAVTGMPHPRDALAAMLWPEYDTGRARAALRRILATLTRALPEDIWTIDRDTIGLRPGSRLWIDLNCFRQLIASRHLHGHPPTKICPTCLTSLTTAAEMYRADLLDGFTLKDSLAFDDWQLAATESLHQTMAGVLEQLATAHGARGESEMAIAYGRRWLAVDPLHEPAHRYLMQMYAQAGRHNAAIQQYRECRRVLEAELGAAPAALTTELYRAIKNSQELAPPPTLKVLQTTVDAAAPRQTLALPSSPPKFSVAAISAREGEASLPVPLLIERACVIGREREMALVTSLWQRVMAGEVVVLEVSGEPGIGKTRLAQEAMKLARCSGAVALASECYTEGGAPYAPFGRILRGYLDARPQGVTGLSLPDHVLSELLKFAPELRPSYPWITSPPRLDPGSEQERLLDSFRFFCTAITNAAQAPIMLCIEDVHWADTGTLLLLRHLARRGRATGLKLLLIITYRDPDHDLDEARAMREVLRDLNHERLTHQLRLERLNREQTRDLLATLLPGRCQIAPDFLEAIYTDSEGNPYYIEELCRGLLEQGKLQRIDGCWRKEGNGEVALPATVRDAILLRIGRLPAAARDVLQLAAVLGRTFDFATLSAVSSLDEETLIRGLEYAQRAHLLEEVLQGTRLTLTFAHALIPSALRTSLSGLRRQRLHRRVAEALEARDSGDGAALAYHYAAADMPAKAIEYSRVAARQAAAAYDYGSAAQHLRLALDLVETSRDKGLRGALLEELADMYRLLGEGKRAIPLYQEALGLTQAMTAAGKWSAVRLQRKVGETVTSMNRFSDYEQFAVVSKETLEQALCMVQGDRPHVETVRLLRTLSRDAWYPGGKVDWEAAERYARSAISMAEALDDPLELSLALEASADVYGGNGLLRERLDICLQRLALCQTRAVEDLHERARILSQAGAALLDVGQYARAHECLTEARALAHGIVDLPILGDVLTLLMELLLRLDRWDEALAVDGEITALTHHFGFERLGVRTCLGRAYGAAVHALRGDAETANTRGKEARELMIAIAGPADRWGRNQHF